MLSDSQLITMSLQQKTEPKLSQVYGIETPTGLVQAIRLTQSGHLLAPQKTGAYFPEEMLAYDHQTLYRLDPLFCFSAPQTPFMFLRLCVEDYPKPYHVHTTPPKQYVSILGFVHKKQYLIQTTLEDGFILDAPLHFQGAPVLADNKVCGVVGQNRQFYPVSCVDEIIRRVFSD